MFALLSAAARHLSLTVSAKLKSKVSTKSTARVFIRRKQTLQAATATRLQRALSLLLSLPLLLLLLPLPMLSTSTFRAKRARAPLTNAHSQSVALTDAHTHNARETGGKAKGEKKITEQATATVTATATEWGSLAWLAPTGRARATKCCAGLTLPIAKTTSTSFALRRRRVASCRERTPLKWQSKRNSLALRESEMFGRSLGYCCCCCCLSMFVCIRVRNCCS